MPSDYFLNIEPDDPEGDAFEEWSSEADLTELLDADTINEILWDLYYGHDNAAKKQITGVVETLWAGELRSRREYD
jgi:hypothetical protein